jgi:[acyl-carrier-protein] S-malonyltransferase
MGKDLFRLSPSARRLFCEANEAVGFDLARSIFEHAAGELPISCAQPAGLILSVALTALLGEADICPSVVSGHSLGEMAAIVTAGVLPFQDAVRLIYRQARLIEELGPRDGAMMAIIGAPRQRVARWCELVGADAVVEIANYNAVDQIVVSGDCHGLNAVERLAQTSPGCRSVRLRVRYPFHSRLLKSVEDALRSDLVGVSFRDARLPIISNADGSLVVYGRAWRSLFLRQLCGAVDWVRTVETVKTYRPSCFVELGAGRVLQGLVRRMVPGAEVFGAQCCNSANQLITRLRSRRKTVRENFAELKEPCVSSSSSKFREPNDDTLLTDMIAIAKQTETDVLGAGCSGVHV